jgi:hypothetical protein
MPRLVSQVFAAILLGSVMWLAYRKFVKPYAASLDFQQRGAVLLILLALAGGFVGSPFWWLDEPRSFAWDLPPLAGRMLASAGLIWVWPGDPLSSRLIGVMLLAVAAGSAYSLRYADTSRVMLATLATYGLGLAVASLWNLAAGLPVKPGYLVVFEVICLVW